MFGRRREIEEAREAARSAMARIESHEKVCTERWNEAKNKMEDVQDWQKKIMWGIVAVLVAVLGKILSEVPFHVHLG